MVNRVILIGWLAFTCGLAVHAGLNKDTFFGFISNVTAWVMLVALPAYLGYLAGFEQAQANQHGGTK